ncbi:coniferyl-aldehyde dehydrogenase [Vibrio sp. 10N.286.49.B3]|uniref:coniferyl aldehyde dehydrogenase n=1 Tax=Vibrio sp. 10N.286.49.B3 TaxID=1880855 RepID=UPI000C856BFA|nr:coniferyl aldehyde dehydrogenase [Vibrio sp. 10N.286.49.B3]PMH44497.1 coniferyl-aldehyde dehydrogenase [Vibrio sp. 10N.286.49.B3]
MTATSTDSVCLNTQFQDLKKEQNGARLTLVERVEILTSLKQRLLAAQQACVTALSQDYGFRSEFDSLICDVLPAVNHLDYTVKQLPRWVKGQKRSAGLLLSPSKLKVHYQPLGVVGVIVPWNFPIVLCLAPIVTALAAGNRVMVKLSEHTPATNQVIKTLFEPLSQQVVIVEGEGEVAAAFSHLPFDHLLFTGSTTIGRLVAQEAAKNLTPVTLELGGKSPVIIAPDADMTKAVDAILLGKSINAGQICVAPDYVLLPQAMQDDFIALYLQRFKSAFYSKKKGWQVSHIINSAQHQRLQGYLDDAQEKGAQIHTVTEAESVQEGTKMLVHLLTDVSDDMQVMKEEIFGPILPLKTYQTIDEAMEYIASKPHPLALYLMSNDKQVQQQVLAETQSGGIVFNDTLLHVAADDAPFGGIGESGMGAYHGFEGFKTFSHSRTLLHTPGWLPRAHWMTKRRHTMMKMLKRLFLR